MEQNSSGFKRLGVALACASALLAAGTTVMASSHREAPGIAGMPRVDNTDLYAFRSYEPGRDGYVVVLANFVPLQDAYGGPNYFNMDPDALYERAKRAGARIEMEPTDQDYGSRDFIARDPEGNIWSFGTYDPFAPGS